MMCKEKIETTAKNIEGVKSAKWNINKQSLKVKFFSKVTTLEEIQQKIANVGYDTEMYKATDESYNSLHYCCKYDRK
jgi:copper chaperone CopZ